MFVNPSNCSTTITSNCKCALGSLTGAHFCLTLYVRATHTGRQRHRLQSTNTINHYLTASITLPVIFSPLVADVHKNCCYTTRASGKHKSTVPAISIVFRCGILFHLSSPTAPASLQRYIERPSSIYCETPRIYHLFIATSNIVRS